MNTLVGSIGYDVHSGLGHLVRDFYRHEIVSRVLVVPHRHYQRYPHWYPDGAGFSLRRANAFLDGLQVLLLFENGFHWDIVQKAKSLGIKIVLVPNYEYTPFPIPVQPDLVLCASLLDVDYYKPRYKTCFLPMPVPDEIQWRERTHAIKFVHNAGHGQRGFAKGTPQIVEAMNYVKSPIHLTIRGQPGEERIVELFDKVTASKQSNITLEFGDFEPDKLYGTGDVFLNAEQYNGMSLMLQEARASGMLVMTTNRYPMNTWLPNGPLIPVDHYEKDRICVEFDRATVNPKAIAEKMDEYYGQNITEYSQSGLKWFQEEVSWSVLKPKFLEVLENL